MESNIYAWNILGFEGEINVYKAGKIVSSQLVGFRLAGTTRCSKFQRAKKGFIYC
ncbi:hypothetical protein QKK_1055 [Clostridioides difficile DA00191]|uniref:hypothetical protein n=1 Tax=Clostridioides difficile TaxID=1496 RepID=UPI00038CFD4D|nr:hypothetical protein [Clostridioides difficile]EQG96018.1 hypothetical protein QKK_1055 [Clostridioides difficile DA00191]